MEDRTLSQNLCIGGMTCASCQNRIEKTLLQKQGVDQVKVSYRTGKAQITYHPELISFDDIQKTIESLDYSVLPENRPQERDTKRSAGAVLMIAAIYIFMERTGLLNYLVPSQLAEESMDYGMLFVIGIMTSVHCVAMCGGINLSQCLSHTGSEVPLNRLAAVRPSLLYNLGRVISYTVVGFAVGALGSAFTFSNTVQGIMKLAAGVFMIIMGINMLGIFPWMRRMVPSMPSWLGRKVHRRAGASKSPLIIGMLNGFMPCGPLQAMQLYALSTGDPFKGAVSMFVFSAGTLPLMFGLGALGTFLSKKYTHKILTAGAVLVAVLGLSMFSQGWSLSGFTLPSALSAETPEEAIVNAVAEDGTQLVQSTLSSGKYPSITVEAGSPVRWVINAPDGSINGCNNRIFIPQYGIEYQFKTGDNIIEFMPEEAGKFQYSCWMGMIRGTIHVVEPGSLGSTGADNSENTVTEPVPAGYVIPTEQMGVADFTTDENGETVQQVEMTLTNNGFSPAVFVVQEGITVLWKINFEPSDASDTSTLLVPLYSTELTLDVGNNSFYFNPTESFDFSTEDHQFYGYLKVVEDITAVDEGAVREEVGGFETLIWPADTFLSSVGGSASCCR